MKQFDDVLAARGFAAVDPLQEMLGMRLMWVRGTLTWINVAAARERYRDMAVESGRWADDGGRVE